MPGYVMHLITADKIIKKCNITDRRYIDLFRIGSIIPDTKERNEKKEGHFWTDDMAVRFARKPSLDMFLEKYKDDLTDPYIFGYYAHLKLDCRYMEQYWQKHFSYFNMDGEREVLYDKVSVIHVNVKNMDYTIEDFQSGIGYYGDYDLANDYLLRKYNICYEDYIETYQSVVDSEALNNYEVGGINYKDSCNKIFQMIDFLKKGTEDKLYFEDNEDALIYPELRILNLKEIEDILEQTAEELAIEYKQIYNE